MTIYDRIRTLREKQGMTQEQLAEKTGYKTRSAINKIESGLRDINQSQIVLFAKALNVSPSYLMGWEEESKETKYSVNSDPSVCIKEESSPYLVAAHALEDLTEEEQKQVLDYANFIRSKRNKK